MPKVSYEWHSVEPNTPLVYHNNTTCEPGKKIKPEHHRDGKGTGRRLCEVCDKLNKEGK